MIGNVDEADSPACVDKLVGDYFPLRKRRIGCPAGKVDDWNRRGLCGHDAGLDVLNVLEFVKR